MRWLYLAEITTNIAPRYITNMCAHAWNIGAKLECSAFQNAAMLFLLESHHRADEPYGVWLDVMFAAYRDSVPNSNLRRWVMDRMLYDVKAGKITTAMKELIAGAVQSADTQGFA